jgi:hypothetical protein
VEVLDVDSGAIVGRVLRMHGVHGIAIASDLERGFVRYVIGFLAFIGASFLSNCCNEVVFRRNEARLRALMAGRVNAIGRDNILANGG